MKKKFFIIFFLLVMPSSLFAFKYASIGFGPNIGLKGFGATNYFLDAQWHPHDNVGARLFVGFANGFWSGVALDIAHTDENLFKNVNWTINFSIPFIINVRGGVKTAYMGFTFGNTLSFDTSGSKKYYFYITPAEVIFMPITWMVYPSGGLNTGMFVSLFCSMGFKVRI